MYERCFSCRKCASSQKYESSKHVQNEIYALIVRTVKSEVSATRTATGLLVASTTYRIGEAHALAALEVQPMSKIEGQIASHNLSIMTHHACYA
jgi:hypothetical protein